MEEEIVTASACVVFFCAVAPAVSDKDSSPVAIRPALVFEYPREWIGYRYSARWVEETYSVECSQTSVPLPGNFLSCR